MSGNLGCRGIPSRSAPTSKSLTPRPAPFVFLNLGYPPLNSATSLQRPSIAEKTHKISATTSQQVRNIATSQQPNSLRSKSRLRPDRVPGHTPSIHPTAPVLESLFAFSSLNIIMRCLVTSVKHFLRLVRQRLKPKRFFRVEAAQLKAGP